MDLDKLYKLQEELDNHIWNKHGTLDKMSKEELLDNTILALLVEVGELANTTRCFKHWSTKGMMDKEIVLDELADCIHFYLSIGNQIKENYRNMGVGAEGYHFLEKTIANEFLILYSYLGEMANEMELITDNGDIYQNTGESIYRVIKLLNFTDQEVEQAYLEKHEENYRRQEEGY